jgi:calcineurin-like phosphoesterase
MPQPFDVATGDVRLCGALAEIDADTGKAVSFERIEVLGGNAEQAYDADDANPARHAQAPAGGD